MKKNRTRLTVGGDRINYLGDVGTPTASLLTVKLLVNSVLSTAGAEFMTIDIKKCLSQHTVGTVQLFETKIDKLA